MASYSIAESVALLVGVCVAASAFAAHPLQTEDTGTQGAGNLELENGLSWMRSSGSSLFVYQPQLSMGLAPTIDLIVQPSWLIAHDGGSSATRGWGDSNVDLKWRFFGAAPLSFAVRAGATLATAQHGAGLQHGTVATHLLLATTLDAQPFTAHANLGLTHNPRSAGQRREVPRASAAFMWAVNERLILTLDAGAEANADSSRGNWGKTALAGAIYTITPSLDMDIGYQSSIHGDAPVRQWLAGITWRFAP